MWSAGSEDDLLINFLANVPLIKYLLLLLFIHSDCQATIPIAKNKSCDYRSRHN